MDPYVYPGTSVLRNLRDIRDAGALNTFEAEATSRRIRQLEHYAPLASAMDAQRIRTIHHHIFQDVYLWAGKFRTVNIARSGQFYFASYEQIEPSLTKLFRELAMEQQLAGTDLPGFCRRAAYYLGEINAIHPFREGNGRTQREFIRQLALHGGHTLAWSRVEREHMYNASRDSFQRGDNKGFEQVLRLALDLGLETD
jgi:cell filamentation protein, protein adenylyltransferase